MLRALVIDSLLKWYFGITFVVLALLWFWIITQEDE